MMDRTDRHFRYFLRQLTRHALLYTEMVTAPAILNGDRDRLLGFSPVEHPLSLQIGTDDPQAAAECARIAVDYGYDEINLNVGCPSDRVRDGQFGACLMARPATVAAIVAAMQAAVEIPVTVKHRIGIDRRDSYADLAEFVRIVSEAGCQRFTVHARKAWLQGVSPKENRTVPPLRYEDVYRLAREFPHLIVEINGGISSLAAARDHLERVDAAMIGRAVYDTPYLLASADRDFYGNSAPPVARHAAVRAMLPYIDAWTERGVKLGAIARHMLGIFAGQPGARAWRRHITECGRQPGAGAEVVAEALEFVPCLTWI